MKNKGTQFLAEAAVIGAIYVVLTTSFRVRSESPDSAYDAYCRNRRGDFLCSIRTDSPDCFAEIQKCYFPQSLNCNRF